MTKVFSSKFCTIQFLETGSNIYLQLAHETRSLIFVLSFYFVLTDNRFLVELCLNPFAPCAQLGG